MRSFTDKLSRVWTVEIDVAAIRRVRELTGHDLANLVNSNIILSVLGDPMCAAEVAYAICKPAVDAAGIDQNAFEKGMAGDAIEAAANAIIEAIADFLPKPKSTGLRRLLKLAREAENKAADRSEAKLDEIMATLDEQLEKSFATLATAAKA